MTLSVFTDGGSRGNPGPASIGFVAHLGDKQIFSHHETIGIATNNVAEYTAIIRAFEMLSPKLGEWDVDIINFKSDSRLLVEQLSGRFKVKTPHIKELFNQAKILERIVNIPVYYNWVKRSDNVHADSLVNKAHDETVNTSLGRFDGRE
ncbi:hypothetical protein A2690_00270 [Candidatus Roizmanbacteria bacterium RIFCSPHIGHO2_01_FULL_39_12b]|uniref:RNase H type-1 domain-containing protein n=1 Tax=Candidatus Roizmanbacteria bacterium RIFCSPHIGHO2_01_FULL_39_12b TaxID=1802030 RepID=A0A1F7G8D9_9BACT|nr:MAG: hypothetical protein A2690_00270 [Candidatus Roizmanbacteria bacterium RIFCSPHIGHO2_01_FULL_39_12b]OGK46001.1 MAG: hypothetical protein A3B46_00560 [Candidatus Roizmanbacteria bacterium RIFCSPLOWO2_01_FULL_39_19]